MGSLFSPPAPPAPPPLPPLPTPEDPAIEERRRKLRLAEAARRGRAATILTSGLGDVSDPAIERPIAAAGTLGGGR
jgi:hypothetical protein